MDWLYLENKVTGGTSTAPDEPGVREWYEAHGWNVSDAPAEMPFVPTIPEDSENSADSPANWVDLKHPDLPGVSHTFPRNSDALEGAFAAGWRFPEDITPPAPEPESIPDAEPKAKPAKKSSASPAADNVDKESV